MHAYTHAVIAREIHDRSKICQIASQVTKQFSTVVQIFIYLLGLSDFSDIFVFINIHEYANFINCIYKR